MYSIMNVYGFCRSVKSPGGNKHSKSSKMIIIILYPPCIIGMMRMFPGGQTKRMFSYAQRNTFHCNGQILNIILLFMMRQLFYSPASWRGKKAVSLVHTCTSGSPRKLLSLMGDSVYMPSMYDYLLIHRLPDMSPPPSWQATDW